MTYNDAKIAMRVLNLDGGEGSGVKGHTTEKSLRELVRELPKLVHELTLLIRANGRL